MSVNNQIFKKSLVILLLLLTSVNFFKAVFGYKKGPGGDFSLRWRESRYMMAGINAYDVAYGKIPARDEIGNLPSYAGYPPWSTVLGVILNFVFLNLNTASHCEVILIFLCALFAFIQSFKFVKQKGGSFDDAAIMCLCVASIPAWYTGTAWANNGTVIGVFLLAITLCDEKYPVLTGILLGFATIKPQMTLLFILALALRGRWKTIFIAGGIAISAWIVAYFLTGVSPLKSLSQTLSSGISFGAGGYQDSFFENIAKIFNVGLINLDLTRRFNLLISAVIGAALAFSLWSLLPAKSDKFVWYSIPAVISCFWTYQQEHDRTALIIF
jgi:hypothetical protein